MTVGAVAPLPATFTVDLPEAAHLVGAPVEQRARGLPELVGAPCALATVAEVPSALRTAARLLLGVAMVGAGVLHLTIQRREFQAQVPNWFPVDEDLTVVASGVAEIALGAAFVVFRRKRRLVGALLAVFLVVIFPGNIAQYVEGTDAFGLDTDRQRLVRLFFQPLLVLWALYGGDWLQRTRPRTAVSRASSGLDATRPGLGPGPPEAPNPNRARGR